MNSATPYADGAPIYQAKGWAGIIPLPPGKKWPPPKAYTGWDGKDPSAKMIETWRSETSGDYQASSNIGIRDLTTSSASTLIITVKRPEATRFVISKPS